MFVTILWIVFGVVMLFLLALVADAVYTNYLDWKWQQYLNQYLNSLEQSAPPSLYSTSAIGFMLESGGEDVADESEETDDSIH